MPAPFLFFCVFIVGSVIMGQSSSTPLSVMTDHEDWESQKKKLILEESSLYPSLIDLDTEISPPPICAATLAPAGTAGVIRRTKEGPRTLGSAMGRGAGPRNSWKDSKRWRLV